MPPHAAGLVPYGPRALVSNAAASWRHADLLTGQQQELAASSTEALRDSMLSGDTDEFRRRMTRLTQAQDDLTTQSYTCRRDARAAKTGAFSHRGAAPDRSTAITGTLTGAAAGLIAVTVIMLTTQPADAGGSYPVLSFFGSTAWTLLTWAGLGWLIGYFLPLIRGANGAEKALWIFIVSVGASLPQTRTARPPIPNDDG